MKSAPESNNMAASSLVSTGLSLAVVWGLKLSPNDAVSAVRADGREGEGSFSGIDLCGIFISDSSALYKRPTGASGCLSQHLITLVNRWHLIFSTWLIDSFG